MGEPTNDNASDMANEATRIIQNGTAAADSSTNYDNDTSCPICLNTMSIPDTLHPIVCPTQCKFNFCISCLSALLASSKDDYQMASDGNRHVKVRLNCPNCRADISGCIEETITLRRKALAEELQKVPDSELSAKELQLKYWKEGDELLLEMDKQQQATGAKRGGARSRPLAIDPTLFGGLQFAMTEQEQRYVTELMTSGYPEQLCQAAQILAGIAELVRKGGAPSVQSANESNGNGGSHSHTAANNFNANTLRNGRSNTAGIGPTRSRDGETPVSSYQKEMEEAAREKLRRPLPARMPLSVTLSTAEFERMALEAKQLEEAENSISPIEEERKPWWRGWFAGGAERIRGNATMTFVDDEWDGSVADAFARARIGSQAGNRKQIVASRVGPKNPVEQMGVRNILALGEDERERREEDDSPNRVHRVLVGGVRGQAGKSGIMKGDVVTHVNGEVFTGDAADLNALLIKAFNEHGKDGAVTIVVNAEDCTAEALRLRSRIR